MLRRAMGYSASFREQADVAGRGQKSEDCSGWRAARDEFGGAADTAASTASSFLFFYRSALDRFSRSWIDMVVPRTRGEPCCEHTVDCSLA